MPRRLLAAVAVATALMLGCAKPPAATPQERHAGLYRSVRAIEGAILVGVNNPRLTELVQQASAELLVSLDHCESPEETAAVKAYGGVIDTYRDSLALWQKAIQYASEEYAKNTIPVEGAVVEIQKKYSLPTVTKRLPYTGASFEAIPEEGALQTVWSAADKKSEQARKAYLALGKPAK